MHERYAKFRAAALPRIVAFRKAGCVAKNDHVADTNSFRLEKKPGVRERIEYLARQAQERVIEKRVALEEQLWAIHEADIGDFFETYEVAKTNRDGKLETDQESKMFTVRKQRAKLINDLPRESRKLIEDVTVDRHGNFIPKLYSKSEANRELRKFHNIGSQTDRPESDVSRLSDAELIQQLADQAKELGIEIDLNYSFAKPVPTTEATETDEVGPVIDGDSKAVEPTAADCSGANAGNERDLQAARELAISAQPAIPQRRSAEAGARKLNKAARNDKR
jgi:Terminase small subunit